MSVNSVNSGSVEPGKALDYFDQAITKRLLSKAKKIIEDFVEEAIEMITHGIKGSDAPADASGSAGAGGAGGGGGGG